MFIVAFRNKNFFEHFSFPTELEQPPKNFRDYLQDDVDENIITHINTKFTKN